MIKHKMKESDVDTRELETSDIPSCHHPSCQWLPSSLRGRIFSASAEMVLIACDTVGRIIRDIAAFDTSDIIPEVPDWPNHHTAAGSLG